VNKTKISRVQLIESPCCTAPSTTMNPVISDARSKERRCVRCRQTFCGIDVEDGEQPLRAVVGAQANNLNRSPAQ
jgi:hypothetical protein